MFANLSLNPFAEPMEMVVSSSAASMLREMFKEDKEEVVEDKVDVMSLIKSEDMDKLIKSIVTEAVIKELSVAAAENIAKLTAMDSASKDDSVVEEIRRYLNLSDAVPTQEAVQEKVPDGSESSGKNWEIKETGAEEAPSVVVNIQAAAESVNVDQVSETPMQHALRNAKRGKK